MTFKKYFLSFSMTALFSTVLVVSPVHADIADRSDVRDFIEDMVKGHDFDRDELIAMFRKVTIKESIIEAISKPYEAKPWHEYRPIFLTKSRIKDGVAFWKKHAKDLQRAQEEYGVPPEIIVSSFRQYAVDFDKDGKRDLWDNTTDVIGSVANYFSRHHWQRGEPITSPAVVKGKEYVGIVKEGIKPRSTIAELASKGIKSKDNLPNDAKAALIELELKKGVEHWLGLTNFYVITRYNHSQLYAMAVYQLSQEIAKLHAAKANAAKDKAA